jgi:hypothetical protein
MTKCPSMHRNLVRLAVTLTVAVLSYGCADGGTDPVLVGAETPAAALPIGSFADALCSATPEEASSLDEYLSTVLEVEAGLQGRSAMFFEAFFRSQAREPDVGRLLEEHMFAMGDLARPFADALGTACGIAPPAEAELHHAALLELYGSIAVLGETWDPNGLTLAFAQQLFGAVESFGQLTAFGQSLIGDALADHDGALSQYLAALIETRLSLVEAASELGLHRVFAAPVANDAAALEELLAWLKVFAPRFERLQPPPEARGLHQLQLDTHGAQIHQTRQDLAAYELLLAAERGEVPHAEWFQANLDVGVATADLIAQQAKLSESWYRLTRAELLD